MFTDGAASEAPVSKGVATVVGELASISLGEDGSEVRTDSSEV